MNDFLILGEGTIRKLRLNMPARGWFPALQYLTWSITESNLSYADLFIAPHLRRVSIHPSLSWSDSRVVYNLLPTVASTISMLPASALQSLLVSRGNRDVPWPHLKDSFSSVIYGVDHHSRDSSPRSR